MSIHVREKANKSGSKSLYLDIYNKGKRKYEFLGMQLQDSNSVASREYNKNLKSLAESIRAKRELELKNNEFGFGKENLPNPNFFAYYNKVRARKRQSLGVWQSCINHFRRFLDSKEIETLDVNQVSASLLEEFQAYLLSKVSNNTCKNLIGCMNTVFKQSQLDGLLLTNPTAWIKKISSKANKRHYLTLEELKLLFVTDCEDNEVKRSFLFSCLSGLRLGDIRKLRKSNIKENCIEITQEKTGQPITVPLHPDAVTLLGAMENEKIFNLPKNNRLSQIIKKWVKSAGIDKIISYHCSRHSFASLALSNNISIYTISKLMGHSKVETTQIYSNLLDSSRKEAIDSLPSIF